MSSTLCLVVAVTTLLAPFTFARVIDLSHKLGPDTYMSLYGAPGYNLTNLFAGDFIPNVYVEMNAYSTAEHGGTHMDAPRHFTPGGMTLDDIPLENTIADGVMIDCVKEVQQNQSYMAPLQKVLDWEAEHGMIPQGAAVLFNFGWSSRFLNEQLYRGSTDVADAATYNFPVVSIEAAQWLLTNRKLRMLGTDTLSSDAYDSTFLIHRLLLPRNITLVENLRDLHKLPARGFRFHASPVKLVGASGAQVRAYAMIMEEDDGNGAGLISGSLMFALATALMQLVYREL